MTTPKFKLHTIDFGDYKKTAIVRVKEEINLTELSQATQQSVCDMDSVMEGDDY